MYGNQPSWRFLFAVRLASLLFEFHSCAKGVAAFLRYADLSQLGLPETPTAIKKLDHGLMGTIDSLNHGECFSPG